MLALRDAPIGQLLRSIGLKHYFNFPEKVEEFRSKLVEDLEKQIGTVAQPSSSGSTSPEPSEEIKEASTAESPESNVDHNNTEARPHGDDVLLVGWYGPEHPGNPRNWSGRKKDWVTRVIWYVYSTVTLDHDY